MVEADPISKGPVGQAKITTNQRKYMCGEATVSTNETITLSELGTLVTTGCVVCKASDATTVTFTTSGSAITITQGSLTDVLVYYFATGGT